MKTVAVILAGGKGSRMESDISKPLTLLNGKALIEYSIDACRDLVDDIVIVYSDYSSDLLERYKEYIFCKQENPLGAGDALKSTLEVISKYETCLVLACDMPLITNKTLSDFKEDYENRKLKCSYLISTLEDSTNYGRVVKEGNVIKIVEEADVDETNRFVKEIATATYLFDVEMVKKYIGLLSIENKKKEYLITDMIYIMSSANENCGVYHEKDFNQFIGVNTLRELEKAKEIVDES